MFSTFDCVTVCDAKCFIKRILNVVMNQQLMDLVAVAAPAAMLLLKYSERDWLE